jgi:uncharacterized protein (DUF608 family)
MFNKDNLKKVGSVGADFVKEEGKDIIKGSIASGITNAILIIVAVIAIGWGAMWGLGKITEVATEAGKAVYVEVKKDANATYNLAKENGAIVIDVVKEKVSDVNATEVKNALVEKIEKVDVEKTKESIVDNATELKDKLSEKAGIFTKKLFD